jgi:hypothetical protein
MHRLPLDALSGKGGTEEELSFLQPTIATRRKGITRSSSIRDRRYVSDWSGSESTAAAEVVGFLIKTISVAFRLSAVGGDDSQ